MKFVPADEDGPCDMGDLDFGEIASLLEQSNTEADAYDVLRGVLERLQGQDRERRQVQILRIV
jgi:hypothetical protein